MEHFIICMEEKTPLMSKKINKEITVKHLNVFYYQANIMAFQDNKCIIIRHVFFLC